MTNINENPTGNKAGPESLQYVISLIMQDCMHFGVREAVMYDEHPVLSCSDLPEVFVPAAASGKDHRDPCAYVLTRNYFKPPAVALHYPLCDRQAEAAATGLL